MTNEQKYRRTPKMYRDVTLRGVLPAEKNGIGISFDLPDGEVIRLFLPLMDAWSLREMINEELPNPLHE